MLNIDKLHITEIQTAMYVTSDNDYKKREYFRGNLPKYELVYRISGENITIFDNKRLHNFPGVVEYLPKGIKNANYYVDKISQGYCIDIFFDTNSKMPTEGFIIDTSSNPNLLKIFTKFYQTWITKKPGYYFECMSLLYKILYQLKLKDVEYLPQNLFIKIEKGINYINEHCFDDEISYTTCSQICEISYSYFKRLFIKKFKMSPSQYIESVRLNHARELLETKRYSVSKIAEMVGYKNVYYFSKVFKKNVGSCPTQYQNYGSKPSL